MGICKWVVTKYPLLINKPIGVRQCTISPLKHLVINRFKSQRNTVSQTPPNARLSSNTAPRDSTSDVPADLITTKLVCGRMWASANLTSTGYNSSKQDHVTRSLGGSAANLLPRNERAAAVSACSRPAMALLGRKDELAPLLRPRDRALVLISCVASLVFLVMAYNTEKWANYDDNENRTGDDWW